MKAHQEDAAWRARNVPQTVAEMLQQRRIERQRKARRDRLEKTLRDHPAVQTYRMEKERRMA